MNQLVRRIGLISLGGGNGKFKNFLKSSSGNVLGALYWQLPIGRKDTGFGGNLTYMKLRRC